MKDYHSIRISLAQFWTSSDVWYIFYIHYSVHEVIFSEDDVNSFFSTECQSFISISLSTVSFVLLPLPVYSYRARYNNKVTWSLTSTVVEIGILDTFSHRRNWVCIKQINSQNCYMIKYLTQSTNMLGFSFWILRVVEEP